MRAIKYRYLYIIPPTYKNRSLNIYQLTSPMIYRIESYMSKGRGHLTTPEGSWIENEIYFNPRNQFINHLKFYSL